MTLKLSSQRPCRRNTQIKTKWLINAELKGKWISNFKKAATIWQRPNLVIQSKVAETRLEYSLITQLMADNSTFAAGLPNPIRVFATQSRLAVGLPKPRLAMKKLRNPIGVFTNQSRLAVGLRNPMGSEGGKRASCRTRFEYSRGSRLRNPKGPLSAPRERQRNTAAAMKTKKNGKLSTATLLQ